MRLVWTKTGLCMRVGGLGGEAVRRCLAEMLTLILALIDSVNWLLTPGVAPSEAWTAAKQQTGGNRSLLRREWLQRIVAMWNLYPCNFTQDSAYQCWKCERCAGDQRLWRVQKRHQLDRLIGVPRAADTPSLGSYSGINASVDLGSRCYGCRKSEAQEPASRSRQQ